LQREHLFVNRWEGWDTGGLAWFSDLTVADPFLALPIANTLLMLFNIETGLKPGEKISPEDRARGDFAALLRLTRDPRFVDYFKVIFQVQESSRNAKTLTIPR